MEKSTINANQKVFLVKFLNCFSSENVITNDLKSVFKESKPIEFVKIFHPTKCKFVRISKADILRFHSWDTEAYEILTKNAYFKK